MIVAIHQGRCGVTLRPDSLLWGMILRELWRPQTTSPVLYFSIKNSPLCWVFPGLFTQIYGTIWNPTYHISSILRHWKFWPCKIQSYVKIADYDSWGCLWWVFLHVATEDFPRFARAIADAQRFMRRELKSASAVSQRDIIRVASWVGIGADFSVASGWLERWWSWWRW